MSKLKGIRLETELDKCRAECNWKKIQELLPHIKSRGSGMEHMFSFVYGEWALEKYLDDLVIFPIPDPSHKEPLKKATKYLYSVFEDNDCPVRPQVALEAHLLLAKIHYVCADFEAAIGSVQKARLDREDIQFQTLRTLRLVAEAYTIKGLAIEKQSASSTSRYQRAMREEQILAAFEKASDLALSYIGELEKATNSAAASAPPALVAPPSSVALASPTGPWVGGAVERIGLLMETALQRVPLMYIEQGCTSEAAAQSGLKQLCLERGVEQYRKILTVSDKPVAQHLHQRLCRQLAEVLVRGVSEGIYAPPASSQAAALKAKQLRFYLGGPAFCPETRMEELLLILTISESIAAREAVLSRAEEEEPLREASHQDVKAVQNLLTLVLADVAQFGLLSGILERALKFAFQDAFVWLQFALSLAAAQRHSRAALVFKEHLRSAENEGVSDDPTPYLFAAMLAVEQLGQHEEGILYAKRALELSRGGWLSGRAQLLLGLGTSLKAQATLDYSQRKVLLKSALAHLEAAVKADPKDALAEFFLALQLGLVRDTEGAKAHCLRSLSMEEEQPGAFMLLGLLLSSGGEFPEALGVVNEALSEFPNHYGLLVLRLKLQMAVDRSDEALETAQELLLFWKLRGGPEAPNSLDGPRRPTSPMHPDNETTADSGIAGASSLHVGASLSMPRTLSAIDVTDRESVIGGTGGTLSEYGGVASTVSDSLGITNSSGAAQRRSVLAQWRTQANIWLELAEMFLDAGRMNEVSMCVEEATAAFPNSHQTLYLRGRILQLKASTEPEPSRQRALLGEAKGCLLGSLALFPQHLPSLRHLAAVYHLEGNVGMAEGILADVVSQEPLEEGTWAALGAVLGEGGRGEEAADAFETALILHASAPILPYSVIPRIVHL